MPGSVVRLSHVTNPEIPLMANNGQRPSLYLFIDEVTPGIGG